jgi:hypothetical protein
VEAGAARILGAAEASCPVPYLKTKAYKLKPMPYYARCAGAARILGAAACLMPVPSTLFPITLYPIPYYAR